jgi:hypothetical protein
VSDDDRETAQKIVAMPADKRTLYAIVLAHELLHLVGFPETAAALLSATFATAESWQKQQEHTP